MRRRRTHWRQLPKPSGDTPAGPTNTYTDLALEAARAVAHFHITDLANADVVIAQTEYSVWPRK